MSRTSSCPMRRTGRVRYGDATEMTATITASRTTGNDGVVADAGDDVERVRRGWRCSTTSAPMRRARNHAATPRDRHVAGQPPAARHERGDHDEPERPERAEARRGAGRTARGRLGRPLSGREEVALERRRGRPGAQIANTRIATPTPGGPSRSCGGGTAAPTRGRTSARATRPSATALPRGRAGSSASRGQASVVVVIRREASQTGRRRVRNSGSAGRTTSGSGWR